MVIEGRNFTESRPIVTTQSLDEAIQVAMQYKLTPEPHRLGDLAIQDDFTVKNGVVSKITDWGFTDFARSLGIPSQLVVKLPNDLLLKNVAELIRQKAAKPIVLLRRSNGDIATIVEGPYRGVDSDSIITLFQDLPLFEKVEVGEDLLQMALDFHFPVEIQPKVGDITKVGVKVQSRVYHRSPLEAGIYLFRLVCSNGAVVSRALGRVSVDYKLPSEERLAKFREGATKLIGDGGFNRLEHKFKGMMEDHFTKAYVSKLWNRVSYVVGTGASDTVFGLNKDSRSSLFSDVQVEHANNKARKLRDEKPQFDEFNSMTQWDLYNSVTNFANDLTGRKKIQIQTIGGTIIAERFSLN